MLKNSADLAISKTRTTSSCGLCKFTDLVGMYCILQQYAADGPNASFSTMNISNGVQGADKIDVPQFQHLMLPLLKVMGGGHEMSTIQIRDAVADNLELTAKTLNQHLPTGAQNAFNNQMGWAITFLLKAGLLTRPRQAIYIISKTGKQVLLEHPVEIDADFLRSYGDFNNFYDSLKRRIGTLLPADSTNKQLTEEAEIEINPRKINRRLRDTITTQIIQVYHLNLID
jgi:restriction endonuclease Mrr